MKYNVLPILHTIKDELKLKCKIHFIRIICRCDQLLIDSYIVAKKDFIYLDINKSDEYNIPKNKFLWSKNRFNSFIDIIQDHLLNMIII